MAEMLVIKLPSLVGLRCSSMLSCVLAGGASTMVMDAELVAVDRTDGNRLRAFQELSTRARGQITSHEVSIGLAVFKFHDAVMLFDQQPCCLSSPFQTHIAMRFACRSCCHIS